MAFKNAATTVVAQTFILVDPFGVITAQLGAGIGNFASQLGWPGPQPFTELSMVHGDGTNDPSSLRWSHFDGVDTREVVALVGPKRTVDGNQPPQIDLASDTLLGTQIIVIAVEGPNGVHSDSVIMSATNVGSDMSINAENLQVNADTSSVSSEQGVTRGSLFGVKSFHAALGAGLGLNVAAQNAIVSGALGAAPVANAFLDIRWTCDFVMTVVGAGALIGDIDVNGTVFGPLAIWVPQAINDRVAVSNSVQVPVALGVNPSVTLRVYKTGAGGTATVQPTSTTLTVVYYR